MDNDTIEYYKQMYIEMDENIPFKDKFLHPIKAKDYYNFYGTIGCFTLDKNKDPEGIALSNLEYILKNIELDATRIYHRKLMKLLEMCFEPENIIFCPDCEIGITQEDITNFISSISQDKEKSNKEIKLIEDFSKCSKCGKTMIDTIRYGIDEKNRYCIMIGNSIITKKDYDDLRQLVCYQNMPDFNNTYVDPELQAELDEVARLKNREVEMPTFEKQMCCISAGSSYRFEELKEISLRKFVLLLKTIDYKLHYQIYKSGETSGTVKFERPLDHWIYEKKKSNLDDTISMDSFKEKLKHVAKM